LGFATICTTLYGSGNYGATVDNILLNSFIIICLWLVFGSRRPTNFLNLSSSPEEAQIELDHDLGNLLEKNHIVLDNAIRGTLPPIILPVHVKGLRVVHARLA
jgi:hypothetical protein